MLYLEVLVWELIAINTFTSHPIEASEITALNHELGNDSMKDGALVMQRFTTRTDSFLSGAESAEVFRGLGNNVSEEAENNSLSAYFFDFNVEENLVSDPRIPDAQRSE